MHQTSQRMLTYVAAASLALPVGALGWFELVYLFFGLTGEEPPAAVTAGFGILAFGVAVGWPLYRARGVAEAVLRSCRLGSLLALLLPVVAIAVLLLWQNATGRRDLGMGGLMLFSLPVVALAVAAVLVVAFGLGARWAAQRLARTAEKGERFG